MKFLVITNNESVSKEYSDVYPVDFYPEKDLLDIMKVARDYIHKGHELLTHPLTGSIKPNETPFKSIAVSTEAGKLNMESVEIIEQAIQVTQKFLNDAKVRNWNEKVLDDFRLIDFNLIKSGIESMKAY